MYIREDKSPTKNGRCAKAKAPLPSAASSAGRMPVPPPAPMGAVPEAWNPIPRARNPRGRIHSLG